MLMGHVVSIKSTILNKFLVKRKKKSLVSAGAVILFFIAPSLSDVYNGKDSVTESILHKSFVFIVKNEICVWAMHAVLVSQNCVSKLFLYV